MPEFTRGLAQAGARVLGVGDQPVAALPPLVKSALDDYLPVRSLWDEEAVIEAMRGWLRGRSLDRVECLWEPGILLAARLREAFGLRGLTVAQAQRFRDKEAMKAALDAAAIRTPRHLPATTIAACWEAAERIGYPLILKPIAGAGSADTYRVNDADELRAALPAPAARSHGECGGVRRRRGIHLRHHHHRRAHRVLQRRLVPAAAARSRAATSGSARRSWPCATSPIRHWPDGIQMGRDVIRALGVRKRLHAHGVVPQERRRGGVRRDRRAAARRASGRSDEVRVRFRRVSRLGRSRRQRAFRRGRSCAATTSPLSTSAPRAAARSARYQGLDEIGRRFGEHVVWNNLLPVGARRRDWRATLVSDGFLMLRHADLPTTLAMADEVGTKLQLYAS